MSRRKLQKELDDKGNPVGKIRGPKQIEIKDSGQSSLNLAHQTDHLKNEHVGFEIKKSETKKEGDSNDEELEKYIPSVIDNFKNTKTSRRAIKKRCELLKKFSDQSSLLLDIATRNATPSFQELLTLLQTYRYGLVQLLKERCYFFLMSSKYEKAIDYAEQLTNLAGILLDRDLEEEAIRLTKFTETKDKSIASILHKKHKDAQAKSEEFLEDTSSGSQNRKKEYQTFYALQRIHKDNFNMQAALDLNSECQKIAHELHDERMIHDAMVQEGHTCQILGKYQKSYNIYKALLNQIKDFKLKCISLCNISVVALLLGKRHWEESLQYARDFLQLALTTGNKSWIACGHGNIGLAKESMGEFGDALEAYQACYELGNENGDNRVINNSYCNLGRAYEGKGEKETAKEYYKKAVNTPQPPKAHWCDTENFRFSGDFLLAKMAIHDQNWPEARGYLQQVIGRCESLRKSVQDSAMKIAFNHTQRKPYQLLQYVLLQEGAKEKALLVGENGRARDFYDKVASDEGDQSNCLNTPQALVNIAKDHKVAVLFLSTLEDMEKLCGWFISPDGDIERFSASLPEWEKILTKLAVTMYELQGRFKIEFRGIENQEKDDDDEDSVIQRTLDMAKKANSGSKEEVHVLGEASNVVQLECQPHTCGTTFQSSTRVGASYDIHLENETKSILEGSESLDQSQQDTPANSNIDTETLATLIDELSDLVVKPIEGALEKLIQNSAGKPELLIMPQGRTFNIPFAALHLKNEDWPLCRRVTLLEAFSFHSFTHSIKQHKKSRKEGDILTDTKLQALIVGNPSSDLRCAEDEANQIANLLGVSPLIGPSVTRREVLRRLPHQRIIHFACHGQQDGSSLLLGPVGETGSSEMFLTIEDVAKVKITADMVVLSACHTARGKINSEGVLGLARAFQMAGAKCVVTALWAIPDETTKYFMEQFYLNLNCGQRVADALSEAQCQTQEKGFKDVVHWGAFKVIGANQKVQFNR